MSWLGRRRAVELDPTTPTTPTTRWAASARRAAAATLTALLVAGGLLVSTVPATAQPDAAGFVPLQAARLFDSRDPGRVVDEGFSAASGPLGPGGTVAVPVAGRGGVPESGVGTVVLTVTGTTLFGSSYLTVWPQDAPRPPSSTLSLTPDLPVTTTVVTKLGGGGAVSLFNVTGISDATVDVVGWFPEASPLASGVPERLLDTRTGPEAGSGPLGPGEERTIGVDGRGFAPAPPGSAVVRTLTGTGARAPPEVTAWGTGSARPGAPALTLAPGETRPTMTIVPVGADGTITVANAAGRTDLLADLVAVVPDAVGRAVAPTRIQESAPVPPGEIRRVPVLGRGGVPEGGVSSVLLHVTGSRAAGPAAIGVWGAGPPPTTSAVVVPAGAARTGFAVVPVSPDGTVALAVAGAASDVALDVVGWMAGEPTDTTAPPPPPPPPAGSGVGEPAEDGGELLWRADFSRGLANYRSTPWNVVGAPTPDVLASALGAGRPAAAFTMPAGGERAEIEPNFRSLREGDDLYFGFSVTLAPGFPVDTADWQVITQWKNEGTGSPPLSVKVGKGAFLLDGGFARGAPFEVPIGAARPGVEHSVVVRVAFAGGGGAVDAWVDGRQTLAGFRPPAGTLYPGTTSYLKTGIYRSRAIGRPGTLYFGDWRIGTSYGAAAPR